MKILVIIVTYNAMRWIVRCLCSLQESSIPVDCIVIDNDSQDETVETIKKKYSFCKLIASKENLGFGKANNIGLQYAIDNNYDFVYLLNQDAWIFPDTLSTLTDVSRAHPEYGVLSPLQMNASLKKLDRNFQICCSREMMSDSICSCMKNVYDTDFVMAAHWLIPRRALLKVGGFSPSFPHYGEDHNYVQRIIYHGFKIGLVPNAKAVHDREFRKDSVSLKIRKAYLRVIVNISNPNNNNLIRELLLQPLKLLKQCISLKTFAGVKYVFLLFGNYPTFIKNRKYSFGFAFLKRD